MIKAVQVTKLLKQRRDENEEAHRRRSATAKAGNPEQKRKTNDKLTEKRGRLSVSLCVAEKRRHGSDRKRIPGEQLHDALKKGKAREAHRLSRMQVGPGMEVRRRHLSRMPAKRQSLDESVRTLEQPINKGGCNGLPVIFSDEVERLTWGASLLRGC